MLEALLEKEQRMRFRGTRKREKDVKSRYE